MDKMLSAGSRARQIVAQVLGATPAFEQVVGSRIVVKLGGSVLGQQSQLLQECLWLRALGCELVLVHGGGPTITSWLECLQIPVQFKDGQRVTNAAVLKVVHEVLAAMNHRLVERARLLDMGEHVVGLNGVESPLLQAHIADADLGFVGEPDAVTSETLTALLAQGQFPIVAPLAQGPGGLLLNVNADLAAAKVAQALQAHALLFVSDVAGICQSNEAPITHLSEHDAHELLAQGVIYGGMIPKIRAALSVVRTVPHIQIIDGHAPYGLLRALFHFPGLGTMIEPTLLRRQVTPVQAERAGGANSE